MPKQSWYPLALLAGAALQLIGSGNAQARSLAVSSDGRLVATALPDPAGGVGNGLRLGVYDARTGELIRQVGSWLPRDGTAIAFSPDGSRLLSTRPTTPCDNEGRCPGFDQKQVMVVETQLDNGDEAEIARVPGRISAVSYDSKGAGFLAMGGAGLYSVMPGLDPVLLRNADFSAQSSTVAGSVSGPIFIVSRPNPRNGRRDDLDEPARSVYQSSFDYPTKLLSGDTPRPEFFPIGPSLRERKAHILDISSDGRRILVRARVGDGSALLSPHQFAEELFLVEDGRERRLTRVCGSVGSASLSPDGQKVVVIASGAVISSDEITPGEILVADVSDGLAKGGIMPQVTGILARRDGRAVADAQSRWDRARCSPNRPEPPVGRITGAALAERIGAMSRLESLGDTAGIERSLRVRFDANAPLNDQVFVGEDIAPRRRAIGAIGFEKTSGRMYTHHARGTSMPITHRELSVDLRASGPCMTVDHVENVLGKRHRERDPEPLPPPWEQPPPGSDYPPLVRPPSPRTTTDALVYDLATGTPLRTLTVNFRNARCAESFSVLERTLLPLVRGEPETPPAMPEWARSYRGAASDITVTPDGAYVAVTSASEKGSGVAVVDARTGRLVGVRDFPDTDVVKAAASADGRRVLIYRGCSPWNQTNPGMCPTVSRRVSEVDLDSGIETPILDDWTREDIQGADQYRPIRPLAIGYDGTDPNRVLMLSAGSRNRDHHVGGEDPADYFQVISIPRSGTGSPRVVASWDASEHLLVNTPVFSSNGKVSLLVVSRNSRTETPPRMTSLSPDGSVIAMPIPMGADGKPLYGRAISADGRHLFGWGTDGSMEFHRFSLSDTTGSGRNSRLPQVWRDGRFNVSTTAMSEDGQRIVALATDLSEGDAMRPRLMIASAEDGVVIATDALADARLGRGAARPRAVPAADLLKKVRELVDQGIASDMEAMASGLGARLVPTRNSIEQSIEEISTGARLGTVRTNRSGPATMDLSLYSGECVTEATARAVLGEVKLLPKMDTGIPPTPWSEVGSLVYASPSGQEIRVEYRQAYCAGGINIRSRTQ